jgi:hypothetical protein
MRFRSAPVCLLVLTGTLLHADVTARYSTTLQFASFLPGMDQAVKSASSQVPSSSLVRMKGTRGYAQYGRMECIMDLSKQEITLFDPAARTYARAPIAEAMRKVAGAMPAMPGEAGKVLASMKSTFASRKTGRTETILGIQADETEGTLTVEGPAMAGMAQAGPMMTLTMRLWVAKPEEVLRSPALGELTGYTQFWTKFMNSAEPLKKMLGGMPGLVEGLDSMFQEMQNGKSVMIRTRMEVRMPMMAQVAQRMSESGQAPAQGFDPGAPLMQMGQELVELSAAPVADSVFQVPQGFREAPFEELVKATVPGVAGKE